MGHPPGRDGLSGFANLRAGTGGSRTGIARAIEPVEQLLVRLGLHDEEIVIRMTGCPNGCVRSLLAELGFVGKAPNKYHIYLGGSACSTRLSKLLKESVRSEDIDNELLLSSAVSQPSGWGEKVWHFCQRAILNSGVGSLATPEAEILVT